MKWVMPPGYTNVIIELLNAAPGGCGNDLAIDDITYGICNPIPTVSLNTPGGNCLGSSVTFTATLSDPTVIPGARDYQWQRSQPPGTGPWTSISGAIASTYTINPILTSDTGRFYRVIVAAQGNILVPSCQAISPGVKLIGLTNSVVPAAATKDKNNICPGISVNLGITGGSLGTNAVWRWYTGSCGTSLIGTGASITVTPAVTTTYYVRGEGDCNTTTCVAVTVNILCDIDKDNDGIPDFVESNMAAAFLDVPANGIINAYDPLTPGYVDYNNDYVNDNYQADGNIDNDAVLNYLDTDFPGRVDINTDGIDDRFDNDLDGIINMLDLDSDNDGVTDVAEAYGVDVGGNGAIDNYVDTDGDGLSDNVDINLNPLSGANNTGLGLGLPNLDLDVMPNFLDLDSDNDGIPDVIEVLGTDANNNGIIDGFVDANSDGLHDSYINATALLQTGADVTADGRADSYPNKNKDRDFRPNAYDMDSDADGIVDVIESGLPDADLNGIIDGTIGTNGWSTTVSAMPSLNLWNTDGSGANDYLDIDADDDGIPDNIEGQSTTGYLLPGITDTDGDGLINTYDNTPAVFGGSGIFVYDHDADATPDYRDLDTDADGLIDRIEGNDFNLNGSPDDLVTLTGLDTDFDGLDNRFDSLISVINIKGTSYMMGNGGSFTGDATPGSRTTVQRTYVTQTDRDWRFVGFVLPVNFLSFTGLHSNNNVLLKWTIIAEKEVARFEIERSTNNIDFIKTTTVIQPVLLQVAQSFSANDDITNVNNDIIYYRLKVIGKDGAIKYSNILVVRKRTDKSMVTLVPNPAQNFITIKFYADKETEAVISMIDYNGKVVLSAKEKVSKGFNYIQLNNLNRFGNAMYDLRIQVNENIITKSFIIQN